MVFYFPSNLFLQNLSHGSTPTNAQNFINIALGIFEKWCSGCVVSFFYRKRGDLIFKRIILLNHGKNSKETTN